MGFEVEPFSVKHGYEAPWDAANPSLQTCNPGRATFVTHGMPPQDLKEGSELIFTYDVKFVVRTLTSFACSFLLFRLSRCPQMPAAPGMLA